MRTSVIKILFQPDRNYEAMKKKDKYDLSEISDFFQGDLD